MKLTESYNFNPGTLAFPTSNYTHKLVKNFQSNVAFSPLLQYQNSDTLTDEIKLKVREIWLSDLDVTVTHSSTTFTTLLAYALAVSGNKKYTILTSLHEHFGGIQAFENLPNNFQIIYLKDDDIADQERFQSAIDLYRPDVLFLSHVFYDVGWVLPINQYGRILKSSSPESIFIVDVAQSIGLIDMPKTDYIDVMFGSTHKWLMGPQGMGILWTSAMFKSKVKSIYLMKGNLNDSDDGFKIAGGRDFSIYSMLLFSLNQYQNTGIVVVENKVRNLSDYFWKLISSCFDEFNIKCNRMEGMGEGERSAPFLILYFKDYNPYELYRKMENSNVHVKCIIDRNVFGVHVNILRVGVQNFETIKRLEESVKIIEKCLLDLKKRGG